MLFQVLFQFFTLIFIGTFSDEIPGNLTDLNVCKISHLGLEYKGDIIKTESGARCQSWSSNSPHEIRKDINGKNFPERSLKLAKNFCRNPTRDPLGPWCYTMNKDLIDETCGIPLCSFTECRLTGPGMEYGGKHFKGISDRKCLKWNKNRNKVKVKDEFIKISKFPKYRFPDEDLGAAKIFCRNPDGDLGGPWCFVKDEDTDIITKEYCHIPFCDDPKCLVFSNHNKLYSDFTNFNSSWRNITFGVKLWDSESYMNASALLVLSLFALPVSGREIEDLGIGIEILISNKYTALTSGNKDAIEYEETYNLLKSTEFTMFSLSWTSGFITLEKIDQVKPIFLQEIKTKGTFMGFKKDSFKYFSPNGDNILWTFPFCVDEFGCDVYITTGPNFRNFRYLEEKSSGYELTCHVRAVRSAGILFVPSPMGSYPRVVITLQDTHSETLVNFVDYEKGPTTSLIKISLPELLNYWVWHQFSFTFFADTLQMHWLKTTGNHLLFELKHEVFRVMRWFSVNSEDSVAHWSFFCTPSEESTPPPAFLPECALNDDESDYKGTQAVTVDGYPCLPWGATGSELLPKAAHGLFKSDVYAKWNYCRDPDNQRDGTFCYSISPKDRIVRKTQCVLRKCKSSDCKIAGTGNDYIGKVNLTRSNRTCDYWASNATTHYVSEQYLNESLYPDMSAIAAANYCRNPSRDISGSWCYTTDPSVSQDVCDIRDCDKPEECIIIVFDRPGETKIYILSQWKETGIHGGLHFALKQWNPDVFDGVMFRIKPLNGSEFITLILGADDNEKIMVNHNGRIVKQITLPHLIAPGKWSEFWLQIRKNELLLGYHGLPNALFEWHNEEEEDLFEPMLISYGTISRNKIGIFFWPDECHTEIVSSPEYNKAMPLNIWIEKKESTFKNLTLKARGTGSLMMRLMGLPEDHSYHMLIFNTSASTIILKQVVSEVSKTILSVSTQHKILVKKQWTVYELYFLEHYLLIKKHDKVVFDYKGGPMLFYWFHIGSQNGEITWSTNCEPVDVDGSPRDGGWSGWSPWHCTVTCGGGEGFRTRTCSNPRPNIFGKMCSGSPSSTGKCNDFECGDISPTTLDKIHNYLQNHYHSYIINEGDRLVIPNNVDILKDINVESPESFYEWTLNGMFVKPEKGHVTFQSDDIIITNAQPKDSGIYICMLHRINKKRVIIQVISLAVKPKKYSVETRATRSLSLICKCVVLAYVYSDLKLKWMLNDKIYKDYGTTTLGAMNIEKLEQLNFSHSGNWQCIIEQKDLQLRWEPTYLRVLVKKAPNMFTNLMEDEFTRPLFGWLKTERNVKIALIVLFILIVISVIFSVVVHFKFCTIKRRKYVRNMR